MQAGGVNIKLMADIADLQRRFGEAQKLAEQTAGGIGNAFSGIGRQLAAGLSVGGFALMIKGVADSAAEIDKLSRLVGVSTTDFQRLSAAAASVGVEQDKLSDILKDVNDKVGEFMQTGGGELKDFFENIAPKVGVTAESFRNLSGPQALQLYVSSLQKAGVSQQEMTFYMEALANDATLLAPLLANNGAEMKRLGDEAERLGTVMDEKAIASAKEFNSNMRTMESLLTSVKIAIANETIPAINALVQEFLVGIKHAGSFGEALRLFGTINPFRDTGGNIKAITAEIESLTAARDRYVKSGSDTSSIDTALASEKKRLDYLREIQRLQALASSGGDASDAISRRYMSAASASAFVVGSTGPGAAPAKPKTAKATKAEIDPLAAAAKEYERVLLSINAAQLDAATSGMEYTKTQQALLQLYQTPEWLAMPDDWKRTIVAQAEGVIELERYNAQQQRLGELLGTTELSKQTADLELLNQAFFDGKISMEQWEAASARLLGVGQENAKLAADTKSVASELGLTFSSAFEDAIVGGKGLRDILAGIEQDMLRIITRRMITDPLANAVTSMLGSFMGGGAEAGASTNSYIGARAVGGAVTAGKSYLVGERGPEIFTPAGHGSIGQTGGAKVQININNSAGRETQASASASTDAMGNTVIDVLVERVEAGMMGRVSRGGGMAPLLERRYGLNPAAGALR